MIVIVANIPCNFTNFLSENTGTLKLSYFGCKFTRKKIAKKIFFFLMNCNLLPKEHFSGYFLSILDVCIEENIILIQNLP